MAEPQSDANRNWLAHVIEGGVFTGALALVNAQTLLPKVMQNLGAPEWLVAQMPVLMVVGFTLPPIFMAHRIARLKRFFPLLMWMGVPQRAAFLVAALVLLLVDDSPALCLWAVAMAPLASGLCGGFLVTAWQQLVARTVEPRRRSSMFAARMVLCSVMGVGAGWVVERTLAAHPTGSVGIGLLHLYAFLGLMVSYAVFSRIREPAEAHPRDDETGMWQNLRVMPGLVARDGTLAAFIATTSCFVLTGMVVPYLGIHAVHVVGQGDSFLGALISWQMGGAVVGGLAAGWMGDRHGGRRMMMLSRWGFLALCAAFPFLHAGWMWCGAFALFGAVFTANQVATSALQLDLLPVRGRTNYLALMGFVQLPAMIGAGIIAQAVWNRLGHDGFIWLVGGSALALVVSIVTMARLPEPRAAAAA